MNETRTIHLVDVPIGGQAGFTWNNLHAEREEICKALLKDHSLVGDERRNWLQARLRKIDDALDRLMAGSYGNCSKCGQAIDEKRLDLDPALALCLNCWSGGSKSSDREMIWSGDVLLSTLEPFDTILLRTHNSDYRILLLDPATGRALVEGGDFIVEPTEALVRGSSVAGDAFKGGMISVGSRLEMWVDERAFLTSPVKTIWVKHNGDAESVQDISAALH
ncbi:MAG TPA: TraR/DksA C4-type zinc finger protein [Pyrinomonadaceae bacterium]|nr:TraR/DksA C4-type zinc finger protein [Pyrinomonadaceae bacterium]